MIDFYTLTSPNTQKIFLMLEECDLEYRLIYVDVWAGEQYKPEFTKINPNRKVPAIIDHDGPDGEPYTVIESGAILQYLAEKTGRFLPNVKVKRYETLQWLVLQVASLGPMCGQLVHFSRDAITGNEYSTSRYRSEVNRLFDLYDDRLATHRYVACDEYTIADIAAFPWLRHVNLLKIDLSSRPSIKRWIDEIEQRPATKKMLAWLPIATTKSSRDIATEDDKDRFFGRGKYARA